MARTMGIDCSTNSLAYAILENGKLVDYGEFFFEGSDINKRLVDVNKKINENIDLFDVDYIVFEKAVNVRNVEVALKMAEFFGAVKSIIMKDSDVYMVTPITWQTAIGNPSLSGKAKVAWVKERPHLKTKSQIYTAIRAYRKQLTMDWVEKKFGLKADNDNISDSVGIAWFGETKLVKNGKA